MSGAAGPAPRDSAPRGGVAPESRGEVGASLGGPFYGWRRGWPLPTLASRPGDDAAVVTTPPAGPLAELPEREVARRLDDGHRLFTLELGGELAAYGWSAASRAHIGGLDLVFAVPPAERYLWDFATLPAFRGRGLYPLLLQEIMRRQAGEAEWFWIGHEPTNAASRRGILKAGFRPSGEIWRRPNGELAFVGGPGDDPVLARRAARALGLRSAIPGGAVLDPSADAG